MLGYFHVVLEQLITRQHGLEAYNQVLKNAGVEGDVQWDERTTYEDEHTYRLFREFAKITNESSEEVWERFGAFLWGHVMENGWVKMLDCVATNLHEFLDNLTSFHFFVDQVAFQSKMRGPSFKVEAKPDGTLRLHYFSVRKGLFPLARGMIRQAAKSLFNVDIRMVVSERSQERRNDVLTEHVIFTLEATDEHLKLAEVQRVDLESSSQRLPMSLACFSSIFPTSVCFSRTLIIEHCGNFLLREFPLTRRRMAKMTDLFTIIQPDDITLTFKSIVQYINSVFIVQFKENMRRNEGHKNKKKTIFSLKGQMVLVNGGNSILYVNSPHILNPDELAEANLFLSDYQRHDAARDLIMLNNTRLSQQDFKKKLEEAGRALEHVQKEVEVRRERASRFEFAHVPPAIAVRLENEEVVESRKYTEVTCLCADLPHFRTILSALSARQVIALIAEVSERFTRLVKIHSCFRLDGLMGEFAAICGAPDGQADHAASILNLALGMTVEAKKIFVPELELPLLLRIGVHSGEVVGGLLGTNRMRFAVWSEAVDIATKIKNLTPAGMILITSTAKNAATSSASNEFVFRTRGYVKVGQTAFSTFFLERNSKQTIWEITQRPKPEFATVDGMNEVNCDQERRKWSEEEDPAAQPPSTSTSDLRSSAAALRKLFNSPMDEQSGMETGLAAISVPASSACSIQ